MKPTTTREQQRALWRILDVNGGWMHKKDILAKQYGVLTGRAIRAVCADQPEHFMSSQKGYKLVKYATDAEIDEAANDLYSRARHMTTRADALKSALNERHQRRLIA